MSVLLGKLVVVQGGGPTSVHNASLFGVIDEAARSGRFDQVLGARSGMEGLLKRDLIDLVSIAGAELELLRTTPGAALGSSRYRPTTPELHGLIDDLRREDVRNLLLIGGNGSLRGAAAIVAAAQENKSDLCVIGVPKTIDNDIVGTDRCPGFASCARYVAQSVRDLGMDVRTLPQPVSIFETMGRSAGWLAAASILGRIDDAHAPHLLYLPERAFDLDRVIGDIENTVRKHGWAVAVVSEGIKNDRGAPVYESQQESQRDALNRALPGGVAAYLADVVTQRLKIRCRSEKPGLGARASALHVSMVDRADAEAVGRAAVRAAVERQTGMMASLLPLADSDDRPRCELVPLERVQGERAFPAEWIEPGNTSLAPAFVRYARRLVGDLVPYAVPLKDQR